jgi:hypothetical protein
VLWTLIVALFVLWLILFLGKIVMAGLIHLLLIGAVILIIVRLVFGRKTGA